MGKKIPTKNLIYVLFLTLLISGFFAFFTKSVFASSTDGTIDSTYKYGWGENIGWINFGCGDNCNVHITDSGLSGYALSETAGWLYLGNITNDGEGILSGYAWGENIGWVKFNPTIGGVIINSSGEFNGAALGENIGWIIFDCQTSACVKTDWRPQSSRPSAAAPGAVAPSFLMPPSPPIIEVLPEVKPPEVKPLIEEPKKPIIERIPEILKPLIPVIPIIPEIFKPKPPEEIKPPEKPIEELVPEETPLALQGKWQLLPSKPIREFVLAPLPKEIRKLAEKFPELEQTLEKVGISKITDVSRLKTVKLTLPGLTERIGLPTVRVEPGKFVLPQGIPIAELSAEIKQAIPTEIVFAKTGGELIDFNITLSVNEKGEPQQKISTISGKPLQLVVKPDKPVKGVRGYVVFKSKEPKQNSFQMFFNQLTASLIFANPVFAKTQEKPVRVEEKLVLLEFEYTDPDGDGIYTAEIQAPVVEGEYEIITVMDYDDPTLGTKEIRLITVVDPEGYVYEKDGDKETRIPGAIVSLYWLNPETKQYELWPAKEYQQENPQITNATGKYSFLVPESSYYLKVETPGYLVYDGKPFEVKEGSGVHFNIELKTKYWWLRIVDWKTILLVVVIILLLYNFYRDKIREKLLRK